MKLLEQKIIKKSESLHSGPTIIRQQNPQQTTQKLTHESHLEQLIMQKYNFNSNFKNQINQVLARKHSMNQTLTFPASNMIIVSRLPRIKYSLTVNSETSLMNYTNSNKNEQKNKIKSYGYDVLNYQKRKTSEYKQCKKRIQMNLTYRGFNLNKQKPDKQKRYQKNQKPDQIKDEIQTKSALKAAERKLIGFAKKKEEQLNKFRNQNKKIHQQSSLNKKSKAIAQSFRIKRSVIISKTNILKAESQAQQPKQNIKQQQIQPW